MPEIGTISDDRAAGTKENIFVNKVGPLTPGRAHDEAPHLIGKVVSVDKDAVNPTQKQQIEPVGEQWAAVDRNQALWDRIGKGP